VHTTRTYTCHVMCRKQQASRDDGPNRTTSSSGRFLGLFTRQRMKEKKKEGAGRLAREAWSTCPPGANWAVRSGYICGGRGAVRTALPPPSFLLTKRQARERQRTTHPLPPPLLCCSPSLSNPLVPGHRPASSSSSGAGDERRRIATILYHIIHIHKEEEKVCSEVEVRRMPSSAMSSGLEPVLCAPRPRRVQQLHPCSADLILGAPPFPRNANSKVRTRSLVAPPPQALVVRRRLQSRALPRSRYRPAAAAAGKEAGRRPGRRRRTRTRTRTAAGRRSAGRRRRARTTRWCTTPGSCGTSATRRRWSSGRRTTGGRPTAAVATAAGLPRRRSRRP
jgi:hypothetical protein